MHLILAMNAKLRGAAKPLAIAGIATLLAGCGNGGLSGTVTPPPLGGTAPPVVLDRGPAITGPDSNLNGVRDDIDQLIALLGPQEQKRPLEQMAQAIQRSLLATSTHADAQAAAVALDQALGCLQQRSSDYSDQSRALVAATLNTEIRFRANIRFQSLLHGVDLTEMSAPQCAQ